MKRLNNELRVCSVSGGKDPIAKKKLIMALNSLQSSKDAEMAHLAADQLLIDYIGDNEVRAAFNSIKKYYS